MHQVARLFASNESDSSNTPRSDIYWVTYDWDGFNENLLRQYWTNLDDENITSQQNSIKQQIDYYNSRDDYAVSKICMPLGSGGCNWPKYDSFRRNIREPIWRR